MWRGSVNPVEQHGKGKSMTHERPRRSRVRLTDDMIREIWKLLREGWFQHDIAAKLGLNQGRVSEVKTGKRGGHITGLSAS